MEPDEKKVKEWVKKNPDTKQKGGGSDDEEEENKAEEDENGFCDIPCILDKYYEKGEKEEIDDVEVYKTELKNNPTEQRIKDVFDGKKITEYDVNQRMDDVFADDTLKQLGFINDLLLYFVKDTIKIVAKDAVINLKATINIQDKMLKDKIKKAGLIKAGKTTKGF